MEKKLTVDRVEEEIAVCFDADGKRLAFKAFGDLSEGDIITAELGDDGGVRSFSVHRNETEAKRNENYSRLMCLIKRNAGGDNL